MTNLIRNFPNTSTTRNRTTTPWDAFRMMDALLGWAPATETWSPLTSAFVPRFDVEERKDGYLVRADVPGLAEGDVDVTVTGNVVTVAGKREAEQPQEGHYHANERSFGAFSRTLTLPDSANLDDLSANLKNGVLTLHIPKRPEVQPRKVNLIKSDSGA
jgi:HSP20 family protein